MASPTTTVFLFAVVLSGISNTECHQEKDALATILQEVRDMKTDFQAEIGHLKEDLKDLQRQLDRANNFVGFSVHASGDVHYIRGATIKYNTVDMDIGAGYNVDTGEYMCPISGYYFFTVTTFSSDQHVSMLLMHMDTTGNTDKFIGAFADQEHDDQGSMSYAVLCLAGEKVFVEQGNDLGGTQKGFMGQYNGVMNGFSGFLIQLL